MVQRRDGVASKLGNRWLWILLITAVVFIVIIAFWFTRPDSPRAERKMALASAPSQTTCVPAAQNAGLSSTKRIGYYGA